MNKKILIFIDWYKPGYKAGGPIRSVSNLVSQLNKKCDFYIVTRNTDYLESTPYPTVNSDAWNNVDEAKVYYFSPNNINYKNVKNLIKEINPDIIYCNSLYSPKFTLTPIRIAKKLDIQAILAVRGMLSVGSFAVKNKKKKIFLTLTKTIGLFKKCTFHATSEQERIDIIRSFGNKTQIVVAQNLPEKQNIPFQEKQKENNELKIISVGRIAPEKNTLYALEILKEVKSLVKFDIYGPIYNKEYWNKCKAIINQLPNHIVVNYKGALPHHQLNNTLKKYHVFFLPSTGENFGHSIIEAMINSCVPLISNKTPWQNLKEKNIGFDIDLNNKKEFVLAIELLANATQNELNIKSKNAHQYAQKIINNTKSIEDYYKLFQLNN